MLNTTLVSGRITHNLELRKTRTGVSVCRFSIAFPSKRDKEETIFLDVHTIGALAEDVSRNFTKGELVTIKGYIEPSNYEDKNGVKHKTVTLTAEEVF